ncbi:nucleotide-binding universal stress UspA family protein [Catenulispora sp. MAP12-49]|uniref:universal stress protein n=1 Tax=Catenulispora sp. MAP12-49 TaxID=3156302 RepID=UPI00351726AF
MTATVAVGFDRTPSGEYALHVAAREAHDRGGSLVVTTAYHWLTPPGPGSQSFADTEAATRKAAEEIAEYGAGRIRRLYPDLPVEPHAVPGYAGKVLAEAGHTADLLVVGNRGAGGFQGLQLGSTSLRTLAGSCCPVIVVRGNAVDVHQRIVAAVDIDENCDTVLDFAFDEATRRKAGLTVTHIWDEPWLVPYEQQDPGIAEDITRIELEREDRLATLVDSAEARHPAIRPFHQIGTGSTAGLLVDASQHADLLVTGAHRNAEGQHGMLLGPVTQALLHHAHCPIAVVPLN